MWYVSPSSKEQKKLNCWTQFLTDDIQNKNGAKIKNFWKAFFSLNPFLTMINYTPLIIHVFQPELLSLFQVTFYQKKSQKRMEIIAYRLIRDH